MNNTQNITNGTLSFLRCYTPFADYWHDEDCILFNNSMEEVLPHLSGNLILTDIPFNVAWQYENYNDNLSMEEYEKNLFRWFTVIANTGIKAIIKFPTKHDWLVSNVFHKTIGYEWKIIQHSPNTTSHGKFNLHLYTQYLVGAKGKTSRRPNVDFFQNTKNNIESEHPAEMPVNPMKQIIEWFTEPGEIIIDPFAGSGTTLKAAKLLKRKSIGIEISEKYCELIKRRLNPPMPLFEQTANGV